MNLSWDFPYSSRRAPVLAENVVAASQPLAVQAGIAALEAGGNAVDAAVAAAAALTVVEPTSNGGGGDAFAIVWDGKRLYGLNGSGRSPAAWTPERFAGRDEMPHLGLGHGDRARRGHRVVANVPEGHYGGAQLALKLEHGYCAASDHRKDGHAAGY